MTGVGQAGTAGPPSIFSQLLRMPLAASASKKALQQALASMGTNLLLVQPGGATSSGVNFVSGSVSPLTAEDADQIVRRCPAVAMAAPIVRARVQVIYQNRNWVPLYVYGTTPAFQTVRDWEEMKLGEMFTDRDVRSAAKVCVIGETIMRELFQGENPVGKDLRMQNVSFRVIGVLSRQGANVMGMDQDDIVLAPWTTIKYSVGGGNQGRADQIASFGTSTAAAAPSGSPATPTVDKPQPVRLLNVDQILAKATAADELPQAIEQITTLLRERHRIRAGQDDDFNIRDMSELMKVLAPRLR
jgi:hypothetical protein